MKCGWSDLRPNSSRLSKKLFLLNQIWKRAAVTDLSAGGVESLDEGCRCGGRRANGVGAASAEHPQGGALICGTAALVQPGGGVRGDVVVMVMETAQLGKNL